MTNDIDILAATAYETGIDPVDYACANVIQAHIDVYLGIGAVLAELGVRRAEPMTTAALSRCILGDLMDAGWTPPEVAK